MILTFFLRLPPLTAADMKNTGMGKGGAITAGLFLKCASPGASFAERRSPERVCIGGLHSITKYMSSDIGIGVPAGPVAAC